jgi:phosphate transport system protein
MSLEKRSILNKELTELRTNISRLAGMVDEAIHEAMRSLYERDMTLAQNVSANDTHLNHLRYNIEEEAFKVLATQQPFALDLRTVVSTIHVAVELERMGDHAAGIARMVTRLSGEDQFISVHKLPQMEKRARRMLNESIQAFLAADTELAHRMIKHDDKLDKHYRIMFSELLQEMRDDAYIEQANYLLWTAHNLERIGDRAVNIAERVIFMATGKFTEFNA